MSRIFNALLETEASLGAQTESYQLDFDQNDTYAAQTGAISHNLINNGDMGQAATSNSFLVSSNQSPGSYPPGFLYIKWDATTEDISQPIKVEYSEDGGSTWLTWLTLLTGGDSIGDHIYALPEIDNVLLDQDLEFRVVYEPLSGMTGSLNVSYEYV